jgi:hypothetical protein
VRQRLAIDEPARGDEKKNENGERTRIDDDDDLKKAIDRSSARVCVQ